MSVLRALNLALLSPSKNSSSKYLCAASFLTYSLLSVDSSTSRLSNSKPCSDPTRFTAAECCPGFPPTPVTTSVLALKPAMYWVSEMCYFLVAENQLFVFSDNIKHCLHRIVKSVCGICGLGQSSLNHLVLDRLCPRFPCPGA